MNFIKIAMIGQGKLFENVVNPKDVVYTPDHVAKHIIDMLKPSGRCLEPCKGGGAFYQYLPKGSEYCELK